MKKSVIAIIVCVCLVGVDQLTKFLVYNNPAISIFGDVLWFQSVLNTGASFSILENATWLLIAVSCIAIIIFIWLVFSKKFFKSSIEKVSIALILSGTLSNLIDRFIFGGVRDFIYLKFINFAIFNVADVAIVVGAIMLIIYLIVKTLNKGSEKGDKA